MQQWYPRSLFWRDLRSMLLANNDLGSHCCNEPQWPRFPLLQQCTPTLALVPTVASSNNGLLHNSVLKSDLFPLLQVCSNNDLGSEGFNNVPTMAPAHVGCLSPMNERQTSMEEPTRCSSQQKMGTHNLKGMRCAGLDRIHKAQNRHQWQALVNMVMNFWVP
jgi:hypothetical protein